MNRRRGEYGSRGRSSTVGDLTVFETAVHRPARVAVERDLPPDSIGSKPVTSPSDDFVVDFDVRDGSDG